MKKSKSKNNRVKSHLRKTKSGKLKAVKSYQRKKDKDNIFMGDLNNELVREGIKTSKELRHWIKMFV
jgi:hypothetical protein